MMWNAGWLWSQCRGIELHLVLILGTTSYFSFLQGHQCPYRLVRVFLGNLWSSIKQIKASYMFDGEHPIALHAMQGNRGSSRGEGEVSYVFFELWQEPGVYSQVMAGMAIHSSCLFSDVRTPV